MTDCPAWRIYIASHKVQLTPTMVPRNTRADQRHTSSRSYASEWGVVLTPRSVYPRVIPSGRMAERLGSSWELAFNCPPQSREGCVDVEALSHCACNETCSEPSSPAFGARKEREQSATHAPTHQPERVTAPRVRFDSSELAISACPMASRSPELSRIQAVAGSAMSPRNGDNGRRTRPDCNIYAGSHPEGLLEGLLDRDSLVDVAAASEQAFFLRCLNGGPAAMGEKEEQVISAADWLDTYAMLNSVDEGVVGLG